MSGAGSRTSRFGRPSLLWRQFFAFWPGSLLVLVLIVLTTFALAAAPRLLDAMFTAELRYQVDEIYPPARDLVAAPQGDPGIGGPTGPVTAELPDDLVRIWGAMDSELEQIRRGMPSPLREAVGAANYVTETDEAFSAVRDDGALEPASQLTLAVDPRLTEVVELTQGSWPAATDPRSSPAVPIEIVLIDDAAELLLWEVGQTRTYRLGDRNQPVLLSGLAQPAVRTADYWQHVPGPVSATSGIVNDSELVQATAYLAPSAWPQLVELLGVVQVRLWYPLLAEQLTAAEAAPTLAQLRNLTSSAQIVGFGGNQRAALRTVSLGSQAIGAMENYLGRAAATRAMIAILLAGPFGVVLAVLAMAARLIVARRSGTLAIAYGRGAAGWQIRTMIGLEGLLVAIPAALTGMVLAIALIPAEVDVGAYVLPAVLAMSPGVALALAASPRAYRTRRNDLSPTARGRLRWLGEVGVLGLAGVAVLLLLRRGLTASGSGAGVDPLVAGTPLLLALALCVIMLRLYPLPMLGLAAGLRRRRGLVGHLGALLAVRNPTAGLAALLALVLAVSTVVFSSVALSTLDRGVADGSRASAGADLRASGPTFDGATVAALDALPGVTDTVAVTDQPARLILDLSRSTIRLLIVDSVALGRVQVDVPGAVDVPAALRESANGALPVVVSGSIAARVARAGEATLEGLPIDLVGTAERAPGLVSADQWILVDRTVADELLGDVLLPRTVLVATERGVDVTALQAEVQVSVGRELSIETPAGVAQRLLDSPVIGGLQTILLVGISAVALLGALAVILTAVVGTPARTRVLAVLRTLGLARGEGRALIGWELGPIALTALIAGAVLGALTSVVVINAVDLRPFTGGLDRPQLSLDFLLLGLAGLAFVLVVMAATGVSAWVARRINPAAELRAGDAG